MSDLLTQLSDFDPAVRRTALEALAARTVFPPESQDMNMHIHTFFSYNGEGWSPSRIAFEMKKLGMYSAAICDFDVLQGLEEFFAAADLLRLRSAVAFESRVFFQEYADKEINSPGEPGVFYFMGMGFVKQPPQGSKAAQVFNDMLNQSHVRNRNLISRVNAHLAPMSLDYEKDVWPLTPDHNATERHIVFAFYQKALDFFGSPEKAIEFWARVFKADVQELSEKSKNSNAFQEFLRSKLMKRGGLGYEQPTPKTFPALDTVIAMIRECRAIPMSAWLDGGLPGEQNPVEQLECLLSKKVEAVNIIPDRNWNFKDLDVQKKKVVELDRYMQAAQKLDLPVNIGTEGNKPGQRLVDDLNAEAVKRYRPVFLQGAQIMVGHTRLLRFADFSYIDEKAQNLFPERRQRNEFFASVGALPAPDQKTLQKLQDMQPEKAFAYLSDCAAKQAW
ncbi:MAG: hypothetical protein GX927_12565 [Lentisphaerae bacterium]|nr:hypothetical protein [Lentisphaerota bacterium]